METAIGLVRGAVKLMVLPVLVGGRADVWGARRDGPRVPAHNDAGEVGRDRVRPAQGHLPTVADRAHAGHRAGAVWSSRSWNLIRPRTVCP